MVHRTSAVSNRIALAVGLALSSAWAMQAAQAADSPSDSGLDEVTVTGSRLGKTGYTTPTPVTVVGADQLEKLAVTNVGALISQLPAFKASNTPTTNGWGSFNVGAQIVNLRGLGVNRNLVLVDGRRFAPVTREGTVDLNLVPTGLVERMEVVTGGASAAYGSDAIAGAVNVILNKKLSGIKGQVDFGLSEYGDGTNTHVSLAGGDDFANGKGHFIVGGEFDRQDGIGDCISQRADWCKADLLITNTGVPASGGVAGQPNLIRVGWGAGFAYNTGGVISILNNGSAALAPLRALAGGSAVTFNSAGQPVLFNLGLPASGNTAASGDTVAQQTTAQLLVPVTRGTSYFHADYDFNDSLKGFLEGSYGHVEGMTLQSRYFGTSVPIFADNPYIPAAVRAVLPGNPQPSATPASLRPGTTATTGTFGTGAFNLSVLGQRRGESSSQADTFRITTGLEGKLSGTWSWDAYYQYASTTRDQAVVNNLVTGATSKVINKPGSGGVNNAGSLAYWYWATDAVYDPADAALPAAQRHITCRALTSTDAALRAAAAGCTPFNPFGAGQASQAALDYVYRTLTERIDISQHVVAANVRGEPLQMWAGPLSMAAGVEYRRDADTLVHDSLSNSFAYFQNFGADYNASQNVVEGYLEGELPLVAKDPTTGRSLTLNGAIRKTRYDISGFGGYSQVAAGNTFDASSWKLGLVWEPTDWARLRFTKSQDIRAPNFYELFQASASSFTAVVNKFVTPNTTEFPAGLSGGNPNLVPEMGKTTTVGLVLQPKEGWASRWRASFDYYDIRVTNYIASVGGSQAVVDQCVQYKNYCDLITFGPNNSLAQVGNTNVNLALLHTRGLDIEADYRQPLSVGDLTVRMLATRTYESSTNALGIITDRVGETGSGTGIPKWLLNLYTTYHNGPLNLTLSGRYIPSGHLNNTYIGPDSPNYVVTTAKILEGGLQKQTVTDNMVSAAYYFNFSGSYNLPSWKGHKLQTFLSINNLLDKKPPSAPATSSTYYTNPVLFDQIGRYYRAGVRFEL